MKQRHIFVRLLLFVNFALNVIYTVDNKTANASINKFRWNTVESTRQLEIRRFNHRWEPVNPTRFARLLTKDYPTFQERKMRSELSRFASIDQQDLASFGRRVDQLRGKRISFNDFQELRNTSHFPPENITGVNPRLRMTNSSNHRGLRSNRVTLKGRLSSNTRELWSGTKQSLYQHTRGSLQKVISELSSGRGANGNIGTQPLFRNKGRVYQYGLGTVKARLQDPQYANERLTVLQGFSRPRLRIGSASISKPELSFDRHWMDYSNRFGSHSNEPDTSETFVNFSNNRLGGGWRGRGNVQEEQMAQQCPEFAMLLARFNPSGNNHSWHTRTPLFGNQETGRFEHASSASPILLTKLRCFLSQGDQAAQTQDLKMRRDYDPRKAFQVVDQAPPIQVISMAAPEFRRFQRNRPYSMRTLKDLYDNAYSAFQLVKDNDIKNGKKTKIFSGLWGAGAFGHHEFMSIAVQYLAARIAGVDEIVFTGIDNGRQFQQNSIEIVDRILRAETARGRGSIFVPNMLSSLLKESRSRRWVTKR